ncbi:MAG: 3-phosphoshikimate 1-carboxyvinyltransferase [Deltaproteobacteria bacterium]|jgi:3-phosphoshikimate 1-carboxyvinyltransferase|nr:3-phosphoshikimate 1-carboxyvinyltransferase [Deltaproteobacteria bacterium]
MHEITPLATVDLDLKVPGSKSITQRALIAAALAQGDSTLIGPLASEDTAYTATALQSMGIEVIRRKESWTIKGTGGSIATPAQQICLGNTGTATRFLASVVALGQGSFIIAGEKRMEERPIAPLIQALTGWGVDIRSINNTGCPPLAINARGIQGGETTLPAGKSSQYLSSLLLVAPYARHQAILHVEGQVPSKPYVTMTLAVMRAFGADLTASDQLNYFAIRPKAYEATTYQVEGDASSASYFFAAAAITGGRVRVENVPHPSLQGDTALVEILARMGCTVDYGDGITVVGPRELRGVEVDMGDCPDVAPTLAIVAAHAKGRTIIKNIAHLRIKECDRITAVATELAKMGARVEERPDALIIEGAANGAPLHGAEIDTYNDHRIAMCFGVAGLVTPGVKIKNRECVVKSFPDFWERFQWLYEGPCL